MYFFNSLHSLCLHDHYILDDKIRNVFSNVCPVVDNVETFLLLYM